MNHKDELEHHKKRKIHCKEFMDKMLAEMPNEIDNVHRDWDHRIAALDVTIAELEAKIADET